MHDKNVDMLQFREWYQTHFSAHSSNHQVISDGLIPIVWKKHLCHSSHRVTNAKMLYNRIIIKSLRLGSLYVFSSFPPRAPRPPRPLRPPPRPTPQGLLPLASKQFVPILTYLVQRPIWTLRNILDNLFENFSIQTLSKFATLISLVMHITWIDFGEILFETCWVMSSLKNSMCFFPRKKKLFWTYLRNGWSAWCETKCIGWILCILSVLDLWPQSWPLSWIFQGNNSK